MVATLGGRITDAGVGRSEPKTTSWDSSGLIEFDLEASLAALSSILGTAPRSQQRRCSRVYQVGKPEGNMSVPRTSFFTKDTALAPPMAGGTVKLFPLGSGCRTGFLPVTLPSICPSLKAAAYLLQFRPLREGERAIVEGRFLRLEYSSVV